MSFEYESEAEEPEVREITPEEFLQEQKSAIRRKSWWAIASGAFAVVLSLGAILLVVNYFPEYLEDADLVGKSVFNLLFRNIFFLLGLFFLAGGIYGLYYAKTLSLEDLLPSPEAIEFLRQARRTKPFYSYIFVGCLVLVTLFQLKIETVESVFAIGDESAQIAGLVKPLVWQGEWWRLLTSATLHGLFPLHLYFNAQALYGFGSLIEVLSNRAHLAVVFLFSIIGSASLSLFFMPETASIGASGGIMGLIGYLAIYGYRRKRQLPPDFLKNMLVNIGFIAAFGVFAYQIVDNFGHLGGLLTGSIYGFLQIPRDFHKNPRAANKIIEIFGVIALGIFITTSIFSILLLLKIV
jgi:membrane associated rhomboid family serine protease